MAYHAIYLLLKLGYTPKKVAIVSGGIFCSDREENYRLFQNRADRFSLYFLYIVEASSANNHLGEISRSKLEKKCNKKLNFLRINFTLWQLFVYISNGYGGFDNGRILQLINFISIEFLIYVVMIQSPVNKKGRFLKEEMVYCTLIIKVFIKLRTGGWQGIFALFDKAKKHHMGPLSKVKICQF